MASKFLARTAVSQAAILAITAALATTNCSPDGPAKSSSAPSVICRSQDKGFSRSARYGEAEVSFAVESDGAKTKMVTRATRTGQLVFVKTDTVSREGVIDIDVTFGAMVDGVHHYSWHTDDAKTFAGEVDGKTVVPFVASEQPRLADGSAIPKTGTRDPVVQEEVLRGLSAISNESACATADGVGTTHQPMVIAGSGPDKCFNCNGACVAGAVALIAVGAPICGLTVFVVGLCLAALAVVTAVGFANCVNLCNIGYCHGPACGSGYRCNVGEVCANPEPSDLRSRCCPPNTVPCGPTAATAKKPKFSQLFQCCETARGETCNPAQNLCCALPARAIDGSCCPPELQFKQPDGRDGCCTQPLCADGSCCGGLGICAPGGGCCSSPCNGACCDAGAGEACLVGTGGQKCCKGAQKCGRRCCDNGEVCLDPVTEGCGVAPCPAGEIPTTDEATGGVVCCPPGGGGCNGACCSLPERCCESPMRCSLRCVK